MKFFSKISPNFVFILVFISLFFIHYFIKLDLNKLSIIYIISLTIFLVLYFIGTIVYTKNYIFEKILINKYFILILSSFIGLIFINIYNLSILDLSDNNKKTCSSILDHLNLININFLVKLCVNPKIIYIFLSAIFFTYLVLINNKINFSKCFIIIGLVFSIISILHFLLDFFLKENYASYYHNIYKVNSKNASNNYAYFQLLPFYLAGFRNIEYFPVLAGYFYSLLNYIQLSNSNKKKSSLYTTIFLGICIFFSYSRLSWFVVIIINITCVILVSRNKKIKDYLKYIFYQIAIFLSFFLIFFYFWNISELFFKKNSQPRSNLFYYSMMKVSSFYPLNNEIPNYFNKLNKDSWHYYAEEESKKKFMELNLHYKNSDDIYFDYVVKDYMNQHLNSTAPRKEIYAQSVQLIKKNIFFGNGNNFSFILTTTEKLPVVTKGNAESDFFQYLLEMGFFGFLLKITIYLSLLFNKKINKESYMIVIMGTFFLISLDLFLTTSQYYYYWIFLTSILSTSFLKKKSFK
jgi:hypothetical protein